MKKKLAKKNILFFKLIKKTEYIDVFYSKLVIAKMGQAKPMKSRFQSERKKNNKEEYIVKQKKSGVQTTKKVTHILQLLVVCV